MKLFRRKAITGTPEFLEALSARQVQPLIALGGTNLDTKAIRGVFVQAQTASYGFMYRQQPAVRSVVDYIARNIAQLELSVYERVSETERKGAEDHPATKTLRYPNSFTPGQKMVFKFVADFLVYDNSYLMKFRAAPSAPVVLVNVPPSAVGVLGNERFQAQGYRFWTADGRFFDLPTDDVIHWSGYDPEEPRLGISKLETLRQELAADATAREAKTQLDLAGLVPKGWIERPLDAPPWSDEGMGRFKEDWANQGKMQTRKTPVLEEGMAFKQSSVSPEDAQLLESRQFTKAEVGAIYGIGTVPPENEEQRQQVYADVLPPYCEMLCSYLDLGLLQGEYDSTDYYTAFNLDEKQMSDDKIRTLTSAAGAPPMLVNEVRAILDLPPTKDGDKRIMPGNVGFVGDPKTPSLPSQGVMPIQDPNKPPQDGTNPDGKTQQTPKALARVKASEPIQQLAPRRASDMARQQRYIDEAKGMLDAYYQRQARVLRRKALEFDGARWDRELAADLNDLLSSIVEREGGIYVARLAGDDFDMRMVRNYLKATAAGVASAINDVTKADIDELGLDDAMGRARGERAAVAATSLGARSTIFAREEAAKQAPQYELRTKTWVADTARHAEFDGDTVPIGDEWPAGFAPGSPPNCACTATIN